MKKLIGTGALLLSMCAPPAYAQSVVMQTANIPCVPNEMFNTGIVENLQEAPVFAGVAANGNNFYVSLNPVNGTWTMYFDAGNGYHCIFANGKSGITLPPTQPKEKNDPS